MGISVHARTIRRQAAKYSRLVEHFTLRLKVKTRGDRQSDEKYFSSEYRPLIFFTPYAHGNAVHPPLTRLATSLHMMQLNCLPTRQGGRAARRVYWSDMLTGFRTGCKNAMNTGEDINMLHVADASINGKHVSNNIHERCNGDLTEVIRNARGFRTDTPCRLSWHVTYHNFLKPHLALHRKTPAKASGIHIPGSDKLLGLIRAAVASRL